MKQHLINDVIQGMIPYLDNEQAEKLQEVLHLTTSAKESGSLWMAFSQRPFNGPETTARSGSIDQIGRAHV